MARHAGRRDFRRDGLSRISLRAVQHPHRVHDAHPVRQPFRTLRGPGRLRDDSAQVAQLGGFRARLQGAHRSVRRDARADGPRRRALRLLHTAPGRGTALEARLAPDGLRALDEPGRSGSGARDSPRQDRRRAPGRMLRGCGRKALAAGYPEGARRVEGLRHHRRLHIRQPLALELPSACPRRGDGLRHDGHRQAGPGDALHQASHRASGRDGGDSQSGRLHRRQEARRSAEAHDRRARGEDSGAQSRGGRRDDRAQDNGRRRVFRVRRQLRQQFRQPLLGARPPGEPQGRRVLGVLAYRES